MQLDPTFPVDQSDDGATEALRKLHEQIPDWAAWVERNQPGADRAFRKHLSKNCLFWGLSIAQVIHQPLIARLMQLKSKPSKAELPFDFADAANVWQLGIQSNAIGVQQMLQAIAWAQALPMLARRLDENDWKSLLACLVEVSAKTHEHTEDATQMLQFLGQVELSIALSFCLPDLPLCKALRKSGRSRFAELLEAMLDGEGMPHGNHLHHIQTLLASCTRVLSWDGETKKTKINKSGRLQFDWLVRQTLRWTRPNGACALQPAYDSPHFDEMLKHALQITSDESDLSAFKLLRGKRKTSRDVLPERSEHSEWSKLATMRTGWASSSARLAISYRDGLQLELGMGSETILCGSAEPQVRIDGEILQRVSDWEDVCWESDEDLDYLELECELTGGWRVQRQLLLARKDQFAFLADAVMGPESAQIDYQHAVPLAMEVELEQTDESTEALLLGRKKIGHVIPLALPEWKSAARGERLRVEPMRLEMTCQASAMYAPLFISLDPALRSRVLTWRQLTVAEDLTIVSKDVAVAYRIRIGDKQWVIYRSLATPGNRTFLGQNLISDFYVARFLQDGETQMLIDVEPS